MKVLTVLLVIAVVLWLVGHIPVGGWICYDETGLTAKAIAGPFKLLLFPRKELTEEQKAKKRARDQKKKSKAEAKKARQEAKKAAREEKRRRKHPEEEPEERKKGGALPPVIKLLPLVAEAAGGLKRRIRIDELTLHLTWAAEDAASAALGYGSANAVMGMIWPLIDHNFDVRKHELDVSVDLFGTSPTVMCRAALTIRIGQILSLGVHIGCKFLAIMVKNRREKTVRTGPTNKQEA